MHFSKTYTQILLDLPPELRDNAIQYRQLKKVINQIVNELSSLGLQPDVLHELIEASEDTPTTPPTTPPDVELDPEANAASTSTSTNTNSHADAATPHPHHLSGPKVVYELNNISGRIEPQLRIWTKVATPPSLLSRDSDDSVRSASSSDHESEDGGEKDQDAVEGAGNGQGEGGSDGVEQVVSPAISGHTSLLWDFQRLYFGGHAPREEQDIQAKEDAKEAEDSDARTIISETGPPTPRPSLSPLPGSPPASDAASLRTMHSTSSSQSIGSLGSTGSIGSTDRDGMQEIIIPLVKDTEFYSILAEALQSISEHLATMHTDFVKSLKNLSRTIADTSAPASTASRNFHPMSSITTDAGSIRIKGGELKSDLYSWREIFQLYIEAEVFESVGERTRGERTIEDSEKRLQQFAARVTQNGLGDSRKFKSQRSIAALETFLSLNLFILNIKKFSHANSEATRKILKKHGKRTALFFPGLQPGTVSPVDGAPASLLPILSLIPHLTPSFSLPRILVQAVGETLLPVIPAVEDYSCLICTSIAFKPIRLSCGHLFCVRCLVKMQKRRQDHCPMCRSRSVLVANRTNVDWALLNFMQDWFPVEAREKLKSNEKEAADEEIREHGLDPDAPCRIM